MQPGGHSRTVGPRPARPRPALCVRAVALLQGRQQQDCGRQLRHVRHVCHNRRRPRVHVWPQQLRAAGAAGCGGAAADCAAPCPVHPAARLAALHPAVPLLAPCALLPLNCKLRVLLPLRRPGPRVCPHPRQGSGGQAGGAGAQRAAPHAGADASRCAAVRLGCGRIGRAAGEAVASRHAAPFARMSPASCLPVHPGCRSAGTLLSFGRPTYGRLGQKDADVAADAGGQGGQGRAGAAMVRMLAALSCMQPSTGGACRLFALAADCSCIPPPCLRPCSLP